MAAKIRLDLTELVRRPMNIGESAEFEKVAGMSVRKIDWLSITDPEGIPATVAIGLIWVLHRRTHPTFTLRELYGLDWSDVELIVDDALVPNGNGADGGADPTPLAPMATTRRSRGASG